MTNIPTLFLTVFICNVTWPSYQTFFLKELKVVYNIEIEDKEYIIQLE